MEASKDGGGLKRKTLLGSIFHEGPEADTENSSHVKTQVREVRKQGPWPPGCAARQATSTILNPPLRRCQNGHTVTPEGLGVVSGRTLVQGGATCSPTKTAPGTRADSDPHRILTGAGAVGSSTNSRPPTPDPAHTQPR